MTNRANFDAVAEKLVNIDRSTLYDIINRSAHGEYVKPVTEAEKNCFDLISAVDFVSGRVDGALARKKYQCNEIKALIYA